MSFMPLFYFPTTIVLVDDDPICLQMMETIVRHRPTVKFRTPEAALDFFEKKSSGLGIGSFLEGNTTCERYELINHMPIDFNFETLRTLRYSENRFNEPTVLIADQKMPEMTGIELCEAIKKPDIKKILLTGEADLNLAINAFNQGLISCFLTKSKTEMTDELPFYVQKLQRDYFLNLSFPLACHLEADYKLAFSDPVFETYFSNWCVSHEITEYYLIDKNANLIAKNANGETWYFIIHTERTLNAFLSLHREEERLSKFISAVENRAWIPFFGEGVESWETETKEWDNYFHSPTILSGRELYFCLILKNEK